MAKKKRIRKEAGTAKNTAKNNDAKQERHRKMLAKYTTRREKYNQILEANKNDVNKLTDHQKKVLQKYNKRKRKQQAA